MPGTKAQLVAGDLSRPETVAAAMDGADKLFLSAGMPEKLADLMSELYALGPAGHLAYVADPVKEVTGRRPRTFRQFAEDHAAAFKG